MLLWAAKCASIPTDSLWLSAASRDPNPELALWYHWAMHMAGKSGCQHGNCGDESARPLQDGTWEGERILPEGWVAYSTQPTPAASFYGAGWWRGYPGTCACSALLHAEHARVRQAGVKRLGKRHDCMSLSWPDAPRALQGRPQTATTAMGCWGSASL